MNPSLTAAEIQEIHETNPEAIFRLRPHPENPTGYTTRCHIAEGSGMVGRPALEGMSIYYEGNLYGSCNLNTLEEKEQCAAGRLRESYPTVARTYLPDINLLLTLFEVSRYQDPVRVNPPRRPEFLRN